MPKPIAIISTGNTFESIQEQEGDFHELIAEGLGNHVVTIHIDARTVKQMPAPSELAGAVLTGSHDMVTDQAPWSEALAAWLRLAVKEELPIIGICYGHQLLAHALGGKVGYHPQGVEVGTHQVVVTDAAQQDPLFKTLPKQFAVNLVHAQSVIELPQGATRLAFNAHEHHQAYRFGKCAWGFQFHPEFSAAVMTGYFDNMQTKLEQKNIPWRELKQQVSETPDSATLLHRFAELTSTR